MNRIYQQIVQLSRRYKADKIVLFGIRARGDHRENSDIDLAVLGMPAKNPGTVLGCCQRTAHLA